MRRVLLPLIAAAMLTSGVSGQAPRSLAYGMNTRVLTPRMADKFVELGAAERAYPARVPALPIVERGHPRLGAEPEQDIVEGPLARATARRIEDSSVASRDLRAELAVTRRVAKAEVRHERLGGEKDRI